MTFPDIQRLGMALMVWGAASLAGLPVACAADAWPAAKPITLVVPFAPGGASDLLGRAIGQELSGRLGRTVLIENKGGAGGVLGADSVARAKPDGYTLLPGTIATHAINNPALLPGISYNAASKISMQ